MIDKKTKNLILIFTTMIGLGIIFYYFTPRTAPVATVRPSPRSSVRLQDIKPRTQPRTQPRASEVKSPLPEKKGTRELCEGQWQQFRQAENIDLQNELLSRRPFFSQECVKLMIKDPVVAETRPFIESCQLNLANKDIAKIEEDCVSGIVPMKAFIVRILGQDIQQLETADPSDLAYGLIGGMLNLKNAGLEELNRNIQVSDALLDQVPDAYGAYKAKLLSLLMKELKYGQEASEETYQEIYDLLSNWEQSGIPSEVISEMSLISQSGDDLVNLPFLRLKAKRDYETLADEAERYREENPESFVGYRYLAEAYWVNGEKEEAVSIIKEGLGKDTTDQVAYEILQRLSERPAIDELSEIRIQ